MVRTLICCSILTCPVPSIYLATVLVRIASPLLYSTPQKFPEKLILTISNITNQDITNQDITNQKFNFSTNAHQWHPNQSPGFPTP